MTEATAVTFDNEMQRMQYEAINGFIHESNKLVARINASKGDRDTLTENIRNTDEFADRRNKIAELQDELDALVKIKVDEALSNVSEDTEGLDEQVKELKSKISAGLTFFKKLYPDFDLESLPKVERLKGAGGGGGGGGGKRIRGYNWIVTVNNESTEYENAASAAKALGLDTVVLQEQFFARAGVEQIKDAPDEVAFGLSWQDVAEDGTETTVNAVVKAYRTGPSGPPTASDSDDDEETESVGVPVTPDEDDLETV